MYICVLPTFPLFAISHFCLYTIGKTGNGAMKKGLNSCSTIWCEITTSRYRPRTNNSLKRSSLAIHPGRKSYYFLILVTCLKLIFLFFFFGSPDEKSFLFDIVANKRNGLDVDKYLFFLSSWSFFAKPTWDLTTFIVIRIWWVIQFTCRLFGKSFGKMKPCSEANLYISLVNSARVLDDQICYHNKDANHIYDICQARFKLHKICYNHKAGVLCSFAFKSLVFGMIS